MRFCSCSLSGTAACLNCSNAPVTDYPYFFKPTTNVKTVNVSSDDEIGIDNVDMVKEYLENLTGVYNVERLDCILMFKVDNAFDFNLNELTVLAKKYGLNMESVHLRWDKSVIVTFK